MNFWQDNDPRGTFKEAARQLIADEEYTLSDLIDVLGEIDELSADYEQLTQIIVRGV